VCAQGKAVAGARRGRPEERRGGSRRLEERKEGRRAGETEAGETEGRKSGGVVTRRSRRWHGDHGGGGGGSFSFLFIVLFLWLGAGRGWATRGAEGAKVGVLVFCVFCDLCGQGWSVGLAGVVEADGDVGVPGTARVPSGQDSHKAEEGA